MKYKVLAEDEINNLLTQEPDCENILCTIWLLATSIQFDLSQNAVGKHCSNGRHNMAKIKNDETNTLFVIALPDGEIKKAVSLWHVKNILLKLQIAVQVRMDVGATIKPLELLNIIMKAQDQIDKMIDPTKKEA